MANDVLRLKTDVLNELRNQKYYAQDELKQRVDDVSLSQREKVARIIELAGEMVEIENKIGLINGIFIDTVPQAQVPAPTEPVVGNEEPTQDESAPDNIVEVDDQPETDVVAPVAELNPQGQTHSE